MGETKIKKEEKKMSNPNVIAIIQARMGSTRLPGKVMKDMVGKPLLERVVDRVVRAKMIDSVVVATSEGNGDMVIAELCKSKKWLCFRGSEDDVLDRFYQAALAYKADVLVRITADCPLIDAGLIDEVVGKFLSLYPDIDYVANTLPPRTYPRGLDVEVITVEALHNQWRTAIKWREHVTANLRKNAGKFRVLNVTNETDYSRMRWCVDTTEDLEFVRKVYVHFGDSDFAWFDVVQLLDEYPDWAIMDYQEEPK